MAKFQRYEPCPKCRSNGRDNRGDNLAIYDDGSQHCFSCGYHIFGTVWNIHRDEIKEINETKTNTLPSDFTRDVPTTAWQWLLQFGLPWSYWKESVGYSPKEGRLVFTVGRPMAFSIGRAINSLGGNSSGEDNKFERKWKMYGEKRHHCEVIETNNPSSTRTVILVEDLISAHKVGQVTTAIPLFGTEIYPPVLYYLMTQDKPVKLWLDVDQQGTVRRKAAHLQGLIGLPVDVIVTSKDPKEQSIETIGRLV